MDLLQEIKKEHEEVRELLDKVANARTKHVEHMKELYATLSGHHRAEEAVAFPPVQKLDAEGKKLIADLRSEHKEAEEMLRTLINQSEGKAKADMDSELLQKIDEEVRHHMEEEETELFKKAREALSKKELMDALAPFEEKEEEAKEKAEKEVGLK